MVVSVRMTTTRRRRTLEGIDESFSMDDRHRRQLGTENPDILSAVRPPRLTYEVAFS